MTSPSSSGRSRWRNIAFTEWIKSRRESIRVPSRSNTSKRRRRGSNGRRKRIMNNQDNAGFSSQLSVLSSQLSVLSSQFSEKTGLPTNGQSIDSRILAKKPGTQDEEVLLRTDS